MITVYKLTTQDNKTRKGYHNECTWGEGVSHSGTGRGELCSHGYIHAYLSPTLAALMNDSHAKIVNPRLWEAAVSEIALSDTGLKVGAVTLTTVRDVSHKLPKVTNEHKAVFSILCAQEALELTARVYEGEEPWQVKFREKMGEFSKWARGYLAGNNRKDTAADYVASAAAYADAARAAASYASYAADYVASAADAAYASKRLGKTFSPVVPAEKVWDYFS